MIADYNTLLKRAKKLLPERGKEKARFEVPRVQGHLQGKLTMVTNFRQIADYLARDPDFILKFLSKELATSSFMKGNTAVFKGIFNSAKLNDKINRFVAQYVNCRECDKPDTRIKKQDRIFFVKCMACGAKYPVKL